MLRYAIPTLDRSAQPVQPLFGSLDRLLVLGTEWLEISRRCTPGGWGGMRCERGVVLSIVNGVVVTFRSRTERGAQIDVVLSVMVIAGSRDGIELVVGFPGSGFQMVRSDCCVLVGCSELSSSANGSSSTVKRLSLLPSGCDGLSAGSGGGAGHRRLLPLVGGRAACRAVQLNCCCWTRAVGRDQTHRGWAQQRAARSFRAGRRSVCSQSTCR